MEISMESTENGIGNQIKILRNRSGLSIRRLAQLAGVAPGVISSLERGKNSPSIATLQKILVALGTNLAGFFGGQQEVLPGPVYVRESMKVARDNERSYTVILPQKQNITIEMLDEHWAATKRKPPFETLTCDVSGYILSGTMVLEVKDSQPHTLRPGDSFYLPRGTEHRGYTQDEAVRLITVYTPPRY